MSRHTPSSWRERLTSPLTWHYAGATLLLLVVIALGLRFGMDWSAINSSSTDALANQRLQLKALNIETAPLRGLDKRVALASSEVQDFYAKRIPVNYSSIAARIGDLALKAPVRLTRVQYTQGKPGANLTEISMDAGITGDYPAIMHFVNSLERDQTFFVIRGMSLTGQQGGQVNLRLQVSTWLRPADAAASGLPPTPKQGDESNADDSQTAPSSDQGKGGQ